VVQTPKASNALANAVNDAVKKLVIFNEDASLHSGCITYKIRLDTAEQVSQVGFQNQLVQKDLSHHFLVKRTFNAKNYL